MPADHTPDAPPPVPWTTSCPSTSGSALDPTVEEISWLTWELRAADPRRVDEAVHRYLTGGFARLVETAWNPGRTVTFTELDAQPSVDGAPSRLIARLGVGCAGPSGTTAEEAASLRSVVDGIIGRAGGPFAVAAVDPSALLGVGSRSGDGHGALIHQRTVAFDGTDDLPGVEVVSRFNSTVGAWAPLASRLADFGQPVRVRATVLATEISPEDRLQLRRQLDAAAALVRSSGAGPDIVFNAERAQATLLDLQASLASPALVGEIAVISPAHLPESFLRSIAASFTSEVDVLRQQGRAVVAGQRLILGGFDLERDPPGLADAQARGLPLRGGTGPRRLSDLITLTESPLGWPIPVGDALPGIPASTTEGEVPDRLSVVDGSPETDIDPIGRTPQGQVIGLPHDLRTRHVVVTGNWGAGKSTVASHLMVSDLRAERPFVLIDPHGPLAEHMTGWARHLGCDLVVLDGAGRGAARVAPFSRLEADGSNLELVEHQISRFLDAVAASLPNPEFASVRWYSIAQSWALVQAAHGASIEEAVVWLNDGDQLLRKLGHPLVTPLARGTLQSLAGPGASREAADVRSWVSSKFHALVSGPIRHMLAAPGEAPTFADLVEGRQTVVCNLGTLSSGESFLLGHLAAASTIDAAMSRPVHERVLLPCYIDEAHRFPEDALRRGLTEGRKFGLALMLIVQGYVQLTAELSDLALASGIQILFRATPDTATRAEKYLGVPGAALLALPDLEAVVAVKGEAPVRITVPSYQTAPPPIEDGSASADTQDETSAGGVVDDSEDDHEDDPPVQRDRARRDQQLLATRRRILAKEAGRLRRVGADLDDARAQQATIDGTLLQRLLSDEP